MLFYTQNLNEQFSIIEQERITQPAFDKDVLSPSEMAGYIPHLNSASEVCDAVW